MSWIQNRWALTKNALSGPRNLKQVSKSFGGGSYAFGIWVPGLGVACTQIDAPGHPQAGGGATCDRDQREESLTAYHRLERETESSSLDL